MQEAVAPATRRITSEEGIVPVVARVVRLGAGLGVVEISSEAPPKGQDAAPVWVGRLPSAANDADLLATQGRGEQWLPGGDNFVVVRASQAGALLVASAFGTPGHQLLAPKATLRTLGPSVLSDTQSANAVPAIPLSSEHPATRPQREIRAEVLVHLEGVGDRIFPAATWAGRPGERKRIEGFAIRPLQELRANEIQYKALHPGGVETAWIAGPEFCGTRGRSLPIVGFAVRVAPHVQDQFSVVYRAAFFRGGTTESRSNGAPCLPAITGDVLEGIHLRVLQNQPR